MLENVQFGWEIVTLNPEAYITVDFKVVSDPFHGGSTLVERESGEKRGYRNSPKHNNSLKTFPYTIQKHLAMHKSAHNHSMKNGLETRQSQRTSVLFSIIT